MFKYANQVVTKMPSVAFKRLNVGELFSLDPITDETGIAHIYIKGWRPPNETIVMSLDGLVFNEAEAHLSNLQVFPCEIFIDKIAPKHY